MHCRAISTIIMTEVLSICVANIPISQTPKPLCTTDWSKNQKLCLQQILPHGSINEH